jgi:hypothetical protein
MTDTNWFDVASLCEAFQRTVARCGEMVALRTPGGAQEISWREYGDRVSIGEKYAPVIEELYAGV